MLEASLREQHLCWEGYCIKDGVNTKNSGKIEAGGNISGRFFENTEVIAKGDLQCNYILNCRVLTYGRVFVEGPIGSIIGGDVTGVRESVLHHVDMKAM